MLYYVFIIFTFCFLKSYAIYCIVNDQNEGQCYVGFRYDDMSPSQSKCTDYSSDTAPGPFATQTYTRIAWTQLMNSSIAKKGAYMGNDNYCAPTLENDGDLCPIDNPYSSGKRLSINITKDVMTVNIPIFETVNFHSYAYFVICPGSKMTAECMNDAYNYLSFPICEKYPCCYSESSFISVSMEEKQCKETPGLLWIGPEGYTGKGDENNDDFNMFGPFLYLKSDFPSSQAEDETNYNPDNKDDLKVSPSDPARFTLKLYAAGSRLNKGEGEYTVMLVERGGQQQAERMVISCATINSDHINM